MHRLLSSLIVSFCLVAVLQAAPAFAVSLASPFGSHMVLQRGMPVPVWGSAEPGETVTVTFGDQSVQVKAQMDGSWRIALRELTANATGQELTVTGDQSDQPVVLSDVLVGEVWLCGGQSNMQWTVRQSGNPAEEAANATFPLIRLGQVQRAFSGEPQESVNMSWAVCSPQTVSNFSAVGYYFGRELHQQFQQHADGKQNGGVVPIGLISSNWGGTNAETWTPADRLDDDPKLQPILDRWENAKANYPRQLEEHAKAVKEWEQKPEDERGRKPRGPGNPNRQNFASTLYNAMIHPVAPYAIRGAIWYQGESNASRAEQYKTLLPVMIDAWRVAFERPNMPFGIVSLANFRQPAKEPGLDDNWAELRWAQFLTANNDPHTGLALAIDIGAANDIHPKNKQDVGKRLAMWALGGVYGQEVETSGPVFNNMTARGREAVLSFAHADGGLVVAQGHEPGRFQARDAEGKWHWADAVIDGSRVVLTAEGVEKITAVRYAWEMNPPATLYNQFGLPMVPFKTDDQPWGSAGRY